MRLTHEVAFGDLQNDLVTPGRRDSKYLGRLLHSFAVQADARNRGVVRDEVLGDVLIEHVPVAGLVVVDRLQIAADQVLVRLRGHSPRLLAQVAPGRYSANSAGRSQSGAVLQHWEVPPLGAWRLDEVGSDESALGAAPRGGQRLRSRRGAG